MTPEEAKALAEKVRKGTATKEEELSLLDFLNEGMEELNDFIKDMPKVQASVGEKSEK